MEIREILNSSHRIFISGHFLTGREWEDWRLFRAETDFEDEVLTQKTYFLRNLEEGKKVLMAKLTETSHSKMAEAALQFAVERSAGHAVQVEKEEHEIGHFGDKVYVNRQTFEQNHQDLYEVEYTIGNMEVEVRSVGKTDVKVAEFAPIAKQFFSIPDLARGNLPATTPTNPECTVSEGQFLLPLHSSSDRWYLVLINSHRVEIQKEKAGLLFTVPVPNEIPLIFYLLEVNRDHERTFTGPFSINTP